MYYEWQLSVGHQWLKIENDHVIETHYCHPGAKGISINTSHGVVFIDFDTLQANNPGIKVQRLSFLPRGQTEDIGWYFRDDQLWCEYGTQGSNTLSSSVSSRDVEQQFTTNPQGTFRFTVGHTPYLIDFSTMTQRNLITGLQRRLRRRPKFVEWGHVNNPLKSVEPILAPITAFYMWCVQICSFDSAAIERQYQLNKQGTLNFKINRYSYTLDFSGMYQVNNKFGTRRSVRRTPIYGVQHNISSGPQAQWQFLDMDGSWKDYSKGICSTSSQEIEFQYKLNPSGTMTFSTRNFSYELSFSGDHIQRSV
uniref:Si:ch211-244b2.3 n=1 Tax=Oreochromis niloticus TaxID=8128 RepID=A0A669B0Y7_ORENI